MNPVDSRAQIRFHHPEGRANHKPALAEIMRSAEKCLQGAVCYVTRTGAPLLRKYADRLNRPGGFFVASIDPPTDLKTLLELYKRAPGRIYIHLGGTTPREVGRRGRRSLMHSKVFLALGDEGARLWVGSHNLTAMAISGGNIEAGVEIVAPESDKVIEDARRHLDICRQSAELFDPEQMERYREIQKERKPQPPEVSKVGILIIHAEGQARPTNEPFTAYVRIVPSIFDRYFTMEGEVRLYLHPQGALRVGRQAPMRDVDMWSGTITGVVRTEQHNENKGVGGEFDRADFDIDMPDESTPPVFRREGESTLVPRSQVLLRLDERGHAGDEYYSIDDKAPYVSLLDSGGHIQELHDIDDDMLRFFTDESHDGNRLIYRPVQGVIQKARVSGYGETFILGPPERAETQPSLFVDMEHDLREPKRPVDPFFFKTRYVIRAKKEGEGDQH